MRLVLYALASLALAGSVPGGERPRIFVVAVGSGVPDDLVVAASESLRGALDADVEQIAPFDTLAAFENFDRRGALLLGITNAPVECGLKWDVWGCATPTRRRALVALARIDAGTHELRGERRVVAHVAVHEVGHLLGLEHCHEPGCPMNDDLSLQEIVCEHADQFGHVCRGELARAGVNAGPIRAWSWLTLPSRETLGDPREPCDIPTRRRRQ